MKYCFTAVLLLFLAFHFVSCKKDQQLPASQASFIGTWGVIGQRGISGYQQFSPDTTGRLEFRTDSTFEKTRSWDTSGTYRLSDYTYAGKTVHLIRFNNEPACEYMFDQDTLVIAPFERQEYNAYAIWETRYIRIAARK